MIQQPATWVFLWPLPLRAIAGGALTVAGFTKFFTDQGRRNIVHELLELGVPVPEFMGWVVGGAELASGLGLIIGYMTAVASIVMLINLGGMVYFSVVGGIAFPESLALPGLGFPFRLPSYEATALFMAALFALLLGGPGRFSVDRWLAERQVAERDR